MKSSGAPFYDRYKDRRYGGLFFSMLVTFLGFVPAMCFVVYLLRGEFPENADEIVVGAILIFCLLIVWNIVRAIAGARQRALEKANLSKLSSDEKVKARSKLLKKQNRISL